MIESSADRECGLKVIEGSAERNCGLKVVDSSADRERGLRVIDSSADRDYGLSVLRDFNSCVIQESVLLRYGGTSLSLGNRSPRDRCPIQRTGFLDSLFRN